MDKSKKDRSHVSSGEAKNRGWSRPISALTYNLIEEGNSDFMSNYVSWTDTCTDSDTLTAGTVASGTYATWGEQWYQPPYQPVYQPTITQVREIIKEKVVTKEVEKRTLFKVYIVDPRKGGKILMDGKCVVAENENQAMLKANVLQIASDAGMELEQLDIYVDEIGTFIRPRKDTQRVKVVKSEDD